MLRNSILFIILLLLSLHANAGDNDSVYFRVNQMGYRPAENKTAIVFSNATLEGNVNVIEDNTGKTVKTVKAERMKEKGWGAFKYFYIVDFSDINKEGRYHLELQKLKSRSVSFDISKTIYDHQADRLLVFMRQQRCGYNPFFHTHCHWQDGVAVYGTVTPDSTFVDATGGWHDAGDQLKYLITGSYATAHMLMAYKLYPSVFGDQVDAFGEPGSNGIPDVLDEAKWGLDWIFKLHANPEELIHQVGDDRDHTGWKYPYNDKSDYGWGKNSYRVAYFANGQPEGLGKFKSKATGVANLAGRSAAAMALAARIWKEDLNDRVFAKKCLNAARTLYQLGREKEGFQQGNSYLAAYRYNEDTWADDMEWGASELYKATGEQHYLNEAVNYAKMAKNDTWIGKEKIDHYQFYPFVNMGHYALYEIADEVTKKMLAGYYKEEITTTLNKAKTNPYTIGVPFIWCSNNLLTGLITQIILYENMTGDKTYRNYMLKQRDWLFGRNPWGISMFTGFPEKGDYPVSVHTSTWALTKKEVEGGLVDGPVYKSIFKSLLGITLVEPDEYARFQNDYVVYHDDIGDYSTNEPTMDGTAGSILMLANWASGN